MTQRFSMVDLSACEVIVFDLDDTLYLEREYVRSGFQAVDDWLSTEGIMNGFREHAWRLFESGLRNHTFNTVFTERKIRLSEELLAQLFGSIAAINHKYASLPMPGD